MIKRAWLFLAVLLCAHAHSQTYPWTPTPLEGLFNYSGLPTNNLTLGTPANTNDRGTVYWSGFAWQSTPVYTPNVSTIIYAANYGVTCDSKTDNTTALAAAISAAQSNAAFGAVAKLVIPRGSSSGQRCITGPQTITGQIWIDGEGGPSGTRLSLKSGNNNPLLTISPGTLTGGTIPPQPLILISNLSLGSEDGNGITGSSGNYTCGSTETNAHGIAWTNTPNSMWARTDNVVIYGMPGSGVYSSNFNGFVQWDRTYVVQNGQYGVYETADDDWQWDEPEVASNCLDNMLWSGVSSNYIANPNIYNSYTGRGLYLFGNTDIQISGGEINNNFTHGIQIANLNAGDVITIWGTRFKQNSLANPGAADDIYVYCNASCTSSTYGGNVRATDLEFQTPGSGSPTKYNVEFSTPTTYLPLFTCSGCTFPSTGTVSNNLPLLNLALFAPYGAAPVYIPSGCQSGTAVTTTGSTAETNLATCTIPANALGANGAFRVTTFFQDTNNADTKTFTMRLNTTAGATSGGYNFSSVAVTTTANTTATMIVRNANATNVQTAFNNGEQMNGSTATAPSAGAIDTTATSYVNINCANTTSAADTCGIYGYEVEILP